MRVLINFNMLGAMRYGPVTSLITGQRKTHAPSVTLALPSSLSISYDVLPSDFKHIQGKRVFYSLLLIVLERTRSEKISTPCSEAICLLCSCLGRVSETAVTIVASDFKGDELASQS